MNEERYKFVDRGACEIFIESVTAERMFHITRYDHYCAILRDGYIRGGKNLERNWPSYSSFFINLGCVCLVNNKKSYRMGMPESDVVLHATKFVFSSPNFVSDYYGNNPVFLILRDSVENNLLSWKLWKEQGKYREQVVPYYEAGYSGNIPVSEIEKAIVFDFEFPEETGRIAALKAAREKRAEKPNRKS
jgi:hypothetical protein